MGSIFTAAGSLDGAFGASGGSIFSALQPAPPEKPPPPPDLTDEAVQRARIAARRRVLIGQGMGATFLSGPLGDGSAPSTRAPSLAGY